MKNPSISGKEYQEGDMLGFWNVREYVLHRDGHKCQNPDCKYKDKDKKEQILKVHEIESAEPSERSSNLFPVNAIGEVLFLSVVSLGSFGSV